MKFVCHKENFCNFVFGVPPAPDQREEHSDYCLYYFVIEHYKGTTIFANHQIYRQLYFIEFTLIRKMVGAENYYEFSNTTDVVTATPNEKPKPNYQHFEKVIEQIHKFDLVLVCGIQAAETVNKNMGKIRSIGKPILFVPHPTARNLSNARCAEIRKQIKAYEKVNYLEKKTDW